MPIPISNNQFLKASYMARQQRLYNALLRLSIARTILFGLWAIKSDTVVEKYVKVNKKESGLIHYSQLN